MSTKQNLDMAQTATKDDVLRLLLAGLAGQRSRFASAYAWAETDGHVRVLAELTQIAEQVADMYAEGRMPQELVGRLGRSMRETYR